MKFKQGFTLIELILVMVIISFLLGVFIKQYMNVAFQNKVYDLQESLAGEGQILDSIYRDFYVAESNVSGCADMATTFIGLSAARLVECMEWDDATVIQDTYILKNNKLTGKYLFYENDDDGGCMVQLRANPSANDEFDIYVDCTNVVSNISTRQAHLLEESIISAFGKNFSSLSENINPRALSITNAGDIVPNNTSPHPIDAPDGKIAARFITK